MSFLIDITFFVPTLNEEKHILTVLNNLKKLSDSMHKYIEVIIIDDASIDSTKQKIHNFINSSDSNLIFYQFIENSSTLGLAKNFKTSINLAIGKQFRLINGDNSEPYDSLHLIVNESERFDVTIPYYKTIINRKLSRTIISKMFTLVVNLITRKNLHYYNGAPLYKTEILKKVTFFSNGMSYSAEVLVRFLKLSKNYREVEVIGFDNDSSSWNIRNITDVLVTLFRFATRKI